MRLLGLFLSVLAVAPVGDEKAPDFTLPRPEGKEKVKLSDFQGKAPVVLVLGSYT